MVDSLHTVKKHQNRDEVQTTRPVHVQGKGLNPTWEVIPCTRGTTHTRNRSL